MAIIYYIFATFLYLLSFPILLILSFKKKYKKSIPARFFLINNPPFKESGLNHFHSCSLGETKSLKPLIENFEKVNLSVITETGFNEAKRYKNADVRYLPFEIFFPFWLKPCNNLIVMEAELWLMLFYISKRRCKKTVLINARISDKSYPKYIKFKFFYRYLFSFVDIVFAQSEKDKERLKELGAKRVVVAGNIKSVVQYKVTKSYKKGDKKVLVAGSTHKGEEEIILNSWLGSDYQLVIVPRHPERFEEVDRLLSNFAKKHNLKYSKVGEQLKSDIIMVDKIGELINFYSIADLVILGGSFVDNVGGHNPLEVAYFKKKLITGPYIFNQKALFELVENYYIADRFNLKEFLNRELKNSFIKRRGDIEIILKELDDSH